MAVYKFRNCKQSGTQTLDEYVTELRRLSKDCEFNDVNKEILSQIIQHCRSNRLWRRALREPDMTLQNLMDLDRAMEVAETQAQTMEEQSERAVNFVNKPCVKFKNRQSEKPKGQSKCTAVSAAVANTCRNCGGPYPHTAECPAKGKQCRYCKKLITLRNKGPKQCLKVNGTYCDFLLDTGASVNILDEATYLKLGQPRLETNGSKLMPYGGNAPLDVIGSCLLDVQWKNIMQQHKFYVVRGSNGALLGYSTCHSLELVHIVNQLSDADVTWKHQDVFKGIGKLVNKTVHIHTDTSVKPVAQRSRRIPFHLHPKVDAELQKLLDDDIIERVENEPTPWVSPIVCVPKKNPDEIRVCVDMREANKAIILERHLMPTVDELIHDLNGASVFSKLDLRQGYHQLELDHVSRSITTFNTHVGIFRYKRLNFGISSASEIFQETVHSVIQTVSGARNISDDILVFGKNQEEHDKALEDTLKSLSASGLKLNQSKCEFNRDHITLFGLVFNKSGISPDPAKVSAIRDAQKPSNISELPSFLGMTSYCLRFIPDYSTVSEPLGRLMRADLSWSWTAEQDAAFDKLKSLLSSDTLIVYYDPNKTVELIVDASPVGLGAILTQENKVVAYASRSLSPTESRYSQTEREALGIVWACEHFDMYLRGAPYFRVVTDHKPLESIWKRAKPPLRIERWGLRLQPYKMTIVYRPGKDNPADYMSRHPILTQKLSREEDIAEHYVKFIAEKAVPKAMTLDEVKRATNEEKTMQKAIDYVRTGKWYELKRLEDKDVDLLELQALRNVQDGLAVYSDNVLLREGRLVLPKSLCERAVTIAHEGHQGISCTKALLRSKVWFPGLDDLVENSLKFCLPCQSVTERPNRIEPFKMSDMPHRPWENLSVDFCGPLPAGEYLFVITDEFTRYPVVEIMRSTSASATIPVLDKVISTFVLPKIVKSDNGSPFNSATFKEFAENMGFHHRRITPRWPRANAQAESFNKPMMKAVRVAHVDRKNWKQELFRFLRQYRNTPHSSTGLSPFTLMFGRDTRTKLPQISGPTDRPRDEIARQQDEYAKRKMRSETRNRTQQINSGDTVLIKNESGNTLTPAYNPEPHIVVSTKGTMISASPCSSPTTKCVTRNSSFFKRIACPRNIQSRETEYPEEEEIVYRRASTEMPLNDTSSSNVPGTPEAQKRVASQTKVVPSSNPYVTRSGRTVRRPNVLKDFVSK
ncbi:uncharacterized protein K02A2.6-like [Saccostrea echinata]|uniref:uncharacterized protein K02A2.6-like n=1 Tax=Saccostrea echinata TaxID=191078 RepID=UPI002A7F1B8C|nr:uncharacterized protein K02A2.6-like [Saccostrea echinata]